MNPLAWRREQQVAGLLFSGAGALCGLLYAWIDSPFYRICHAPGGFANCSKMLGTWLGYPSQYWLFVAIGALIPGMIFYGLRILKAQ